MSASILMPKAAALERMKALVLDTLTSGESKRACNRALDHFLRWCVSEAVGGFNKAAVNRYRAEMETRGLAPSSINISLAAIRKLAVEAADNRLIEADVAAAISRVKGVKSSESRTGQWLTREQAESLLAAPDVTTMKGKRDRALLAVLVGCGLRRKEATELGVEHIQLREARWVVVDIEGKGGRVRSVPMPSWTKGAIDVWTADAAITTGRVFRSINKGGRITGDTTTTQSIFEVVRLYGGRIGVPKLAPHDTRRTFARLAHKGRAALEQIQLSLGHASVTTTERYLGTRQDLTDAPCDHLGLKVEVSA
jgi:integrase